METEKKTLTAKDSEDCCIECGLLISSIRQIKQPGCCLCQSCAEKLSSCESSQ